MESMELREKLIRLRKERGLTQLELAEALDLSRQAVSRWETGLSMPGTDALIKLSRFYGLPLDYFAGGGEGEPAESAAPDGAEEPPRAARGMPSRAVLIATGALALAAVALLLYWLGAEAPVPAGLCALLGLR